MPWDEVLLQGLSVERIPTSVLMITGKTTRLITTATFDQMPIPNHKINRGEIAMMGVA